MANALGYQQITLGTAQSLSPPAGAEYAVMVPEGDMRYRDDGTDPTTSVGMLVPDKARFVYDGPLGKFRAIQVTSAKLNVLYYAT